MWPSTDETNFSWYGWMIIGNSYDGIRASGGLVPAISFESSFIFEFNLGDRPFRYPLPPRARSIRHWVRDRMQKVHALNAGPRFGKLQATTGNAQIQIDSDNMILTVEAGFPSAVLQGCLLTSGKWYYEFTIRNNGVCQIGWADLEFVGSTRDGVGVGDDKHSWGISTLNQQLYYGALLHFCMIYIMI
jgi:hypothetical protein